MKKRLVLIFLACAVASCNAQVSLIACGKECTTIDCGDLHISIKTAVWGRTVLNECTGSLTSADLEDECELDVLCYMSPLCDDMTSCTFTPKKNIFGGKAMRPCRKKKYLNLTYTCEGGTTQASSTPIPEATTPTPTPIATTPVVTTPVPVSSRRRRRRSAAVVTTPAVTMPVSTRAATTEETPTPTPEATTPVATRATTPMPVSSRRRRRRSAAVVTTPVATVPVSTRAATTEETPTPTPDATTPVATRATTPMPVSSRRRRRRSAAVVTTPVATMPVSTKTATSESTPTPVATTPVPAAATSPSCSMDATVVCQGMAQKLSCPDEEEVYICNATYGRSDSITCPNDDVTTTETCSSDAKLTLERTSCLNRECSPHAIDAYYGVSCAQSYLTIFWTCIPCTIPPVDPQ